MQITRFWIPTLALATTVTLDACNLCGPDQHAITTSAPNNLTLGGDFGTRQIQYVNIRLTEPPATHDQFQFVYDALEGSRDGEGAAISFGGTDAETQEIVTLVLALPVALRQGDSYPIGATFSVEVGSNAEGKLWGAHDLQDPNKADVAFVIAKYTFPPAEYTPSFRAVASTGTIQVVGRSDGHVQLALNLTFTDANGAVRTVTGNAQADNETRAALCN